MNIWGFETMTYATFIIGCFFAIAALIMPETRIFEPEEVPESPDLSDQPLITPIESTYFEKVSSVRF